MKRLVIFDLDGTLLNTIADLAASTDYALGKNGFPTHELHEYNYFVGNGINKLFERALPDGAKTEENISAVRKDFLTHYNIHNTDRSCPYAGIPELLSALQARGIAVAVASNKYHAGTGKLAAHFFPEIRFAAVLGQRDGIPTKPDPAVVEEIIGKTGVNKEDVLYVGDSNVDMQTAINSGVDACGVAWGFRPVSELEQYHPKFIAKKAEDILDFIAKDIKKDGE